MERQWGVWLRQNCTFDCVSIVLDCVINRNKCSLCRLYEICDEFNYLFEKERKQLIYKYYYIKPYVGLDSHFNSRRLETSRKLSKLCKIIKECLINVCTNFQL